MGVRGFEGDRTDSASLETTLSAPALEGGARPLTLAALRAAREGEMPVAGPVEVGGAGECVLVCGGGGPTLKAGSGTLDRSFQDLRP